jgi:Fe-S-cluster containining protein
MELRTTRPRTCVKCRLHGKVSILRGHRNNCPFLHCGCSMCSVHEKRKETCTITRNVEESTPLTQSAFPELVLSTMNVAESHSRSQLKSVQQKREGKNAVYLARVPISTNVHLMAISMQFVRRNFAL